VLRIELAAKGAGVGELLLNSIELGVAGFGATPLTVALFFPLDFLEGLNFVAKARHLDVSFLFPPASLLQPVSNVEVPRLAFSDHPVPGSFGIVPARISMPAPGR
jgi:hypothetical protein